MSQIRGVWGRWAHIAAILLILLLIGVAATLFLMPHTKASLRHVRQSVVISRAEAPVADAVLQKAENIDHGRPAAAAVQPVPGGQDKLLPLQDNSFAGVKAGKGWCQNTLTSWSKSPLGQHATPWVPPAATPCTMLCKLHAACRHPSHAPLPPPPRMPCTFFYLQTVHFYLPMQLFFLICECHFFVNKMSKASLPST